MNSNNTEAESAFSAIRAIDYTVIIVRNMHAMRDFYESILQLKFLRELSSNWVEYEIGANTLALSNPGLTATDTPIPEGTAAVQLAFKVPVDWVDRCAEELAKKNIVIVSPPTDRDFGHRTLFFRDPDGNLLEIFADLPVVQ